VGFVPTPNLIEHIGALQTSLFRLRDPIPPAVIELFNRLLEEAHSRSNDQSLVHEIPFADRETLRDELMLWTKQQEVALRRY
jgi:hypothetical protein